MATIFMCEFSISIFLYSPVQNPLGPLLYYYYRDGQYGRMAAVGIVITLICIILVAPKDFLAGEGDDLLETLRLASV